MNAVHLGYKDGGHGLIERCAVHVHYSREWQYECSDSLINMKDLLQTAKCDRQRLRTVDNTVNIILISDNHYTDFNYSKRRQTANYLAEVPTYNPATYNYI